MTSQVKATINCYRGWDGYGACRGRIGKWKKQNRKQQSPQTTILIVRPSRLQLECNLIPILPAFEELRIGLYLRHIIPHVLTPWFLEHQLSQWNQSLEPDGHLPTKRRRRDVGYIVNETKTWYRERTSDKRLMCARLCVAPKGLVCINLVADSLGCSSSWSRGASKWAIHR